MSLKYNALWLNEQRGTIGMSGAFDTFDEAADAATLKIDRDGGRHSFVALLPQKRACDLVPEDLVAA